jgi:protein O-GlcNAc transferase
MAPHSPPRPSELQQRLTSALGFHQRGELAAARALYREILKDHPASFDALHLLGILCTDIGAPQEGIDLIRRALRIDAANARAHYSLASALIARGDDGAALASLEAAIARQSNFVDAWFLRGNVLQKLASFAEAAACYGEVIRLKSDFAPAYNNLAAAQRALRQLPEALASANAAVALQAAYPRALNNRGLILLDAKQGTAAVEDFQRALALTPAFPEALHNLGIALTQLRRFAEARDVFARLAELSPQFPHAQGNLLSAKLSIADWSGLQPLIDGVTNAVARGEHAVLPVTFLCVCGSATLQQRCAQRYTQGHFPPRPAPQPRPHRAHDRIRVAYLSGDFGEHAITYLLCGVLEKHDAERFETIALSWDRKTEGAARQRVAGAFSRFIDVTALSDPEMASLMRELEVDIAVDLCGHTLGQRTQVMASRAAPLQINYLGLPMTMGAPYMDYLIADRYLIPEAHQAQYSEQVIWLPDCYQPNDDRRELAVAPRPRAAFGLPEQGFVFCSFNRNAKLNPMTFDIWMALLRSVDDSVLWLLASEASAAENLRREAQARGVDPQRLVFAGDTAYADYLARYQHTDLFLDTTPFNGGATVSDALSMGVPVLTYAGESFAGRMAGSILTSLGLAELVAPSLAEYQTRALRIAHDPTYLAALRTHLHKRSEHAYFETDRYRRHLESAYLAIWERHRAQLAPASLEIKRINGATSEA